MAIHIHDNAEGGGKSLRVIRPSEKSVSRFSLMFLQCPLMLVQTNRFFLLVLFSTCRKMFIGGLSWQTSPGRFVVVTTTT